nr:glycosyltransferase family 4 protein [Nocardioides sp. zg-DK7169]
MNYAPEETGIAPYTAGMVRGLAQEFDVSVVTAYPHYPQWEIAPGYSGWSMSESDAGVPVRRLRHYVPGNPGGASRILSEASFAARIGLSRAGKPDAIVAITPALLPLLPAVAQAARRGIPVGVVVQDLYGKAASELGLMGGRLDRAVNALEGRLLRSASAVTTIHERMARSIADDHRVSADRLRVIPNWTHISPPTGDRDSTRTRLGWDGEFVLLHAGNMGAKQGLEHVVEAARLADERGTDVRIVLMGDGARRRGLEALASGVRRVEFMDPVPGAEFADVVAAADALLLHERPGLKEMCAPSKLTSYFAAGRPVLGATDPDSAAAFEIQASGAGIVVEPGDPSAFLEGLAILQKEDGTALGSRGRDYATGRLSEENAMDSYRNWVRDLIKRGR